MKKRKWNVKLLAIFPVMILLGFLYLYFTGFAYPGKVTISQAYSFKEGEDGRRYLLDQGHERLLCMDQQNKLLYSIENPQDDQKQTLYIFPSLSSTKRLSSKKTQSLIRVSASL